MGSGRGGLETNQLLDFQGTVHYGVRMSGSSREEGRRRRARVQAWVRQEKARPCADCRVKYPYYVMQFDHRPEHVKLSGISELLHGNFSQVRLRAEIAKCDVVCANCHAERTHQRKQAPPSLADIF